MDSKAKKTPASRARSKSPAAASTQKRKKAEPSSTTKRSKSPAPRKTPVKAVKEEKDKLSPAERKAEDARAILIITVGLLVPWIVFPLFGVKIDGFLESMAFSTKLDVKNPLALLTLVAVLSTPHVFYAWVWTNSSKWSKICHKKALEPYKAFAMCAHIIKAVQFAAIAIWALPLIKDPIGQITNIHPLKAVLVAQLFGMGQLLNVQVYKKIGEAGVYYGTRLGVHVPWVFGFPFSVVPHPQYFGATLSFVGLFILLVNETTVSQGIYVLCAVIAFYYAFSSYAEANW